MYHILKMKMYKNVVLAACTLLVSLNVFAQDESEKPGGVEPSNWFTGGSVSLGYSGGYNNTFNVGLHPHYGYTLAKWIDVAAVVNFEYQTQRDEFNNKYRLTTYGLGAFTRIFPVQFLFIQAEPEFNFIAQKVIPGNSALSTYKQTLNAPSLLVGGGYTTSRNGKNSFTYLSILVDVLKDENSPYVDGYGNLLPIIRAGVNIGLNRKRR